MDDSRGNSQSVPHVGKTDHFSRSPSSPFGLGPRETLAYRQRFRGMIGVSSKVPLKDRSVLSLLSSSKPLVG
jgi:hypothetical protein